MKNKKYFAYCVPSTTVSGIADNWEDCKAKVSGKPNARYKGFGTEKEAEEWLMAGADYSFRGDLEPGIYFDAGTGRGKGVEASVTDENGQNLLAEVLPKKNLNKFGKYVLAGGVTNNYGELLALSLAFKVATKKKIKKIFGDSRLVIKFWSKGFVKKENVSKKTFDLTNEVFALRQKFEKGGGKIRHISGDKNPADLGFHK